MADSRFASVGDQQVVSNSMSMSLRVGRWWSAARTGNIGIVLRNRLRLGQSPLMRRRPIPELQGFTARRINTLVREVPGLQRYLEIGVDRARTFQEVTAAERTGVDPAPRFNSARLPANVRFYVETSDEFFAQLAPDRRFDIVFLDGMHTHEQTYRDVLNAAAHCPTGVIIVDDVVPADEVSAMRDQVQSLALRAQRGLAGAPWHGDVFRIVPALHRHHPEFDFVTIVDGGNPQLLLWRRDPDSALSPAVTLHDVESLRYDDVFGEGIPATFRPMSELDGLRLVADTLRHREMPSAAR